VLSLIHTLCSSLSLQCLHQLLPGNGFQRQTFPSLRVPKLSLCLSYQLLTATAHKDWTAAVLYLSISLTHQPTRSTPLHCTALTELCRSSHMASERTHKEHRLHLFYCCVTSPWMWRVSLLRMYRPLPSNGSTCYNIYKIQDAQICKILRLYSHCHWNSVVKQSVIMK
jgi:hypothetical protein